MMDRCTLTGADDSIPQELLWDLAKPYQFDSRQGQVEWGILYSRSQQGTGRYPSFSWIETLVRCVAVHEPHERPKFALHVCGKAVEDFVQGIGHVTEVARHFDRVQLNFQAANYSLPTLRAMLNRNAGRCIITQYNDGNQHLAGVLTSSFNHAVLFDSSGGQGIERSNWPAPLPAVYCGYAGGLGPDNIQQQLTRIHHVTAGRGYWIDMEGKLRNSGDRFDVDQVKKVLCEIFATLASLTAAPDQEQVPRNVATAGG